MPPTNDAIADQLDEIARLLDTQEDANPFRVRAYRQAADQVRDTDRSVSKIVNEEGGEALEQIPNIGSSLAGVIVEIVHQGHSSLLQRLRGEVEPGDAFTVIPGIGEELSQRIVEHLDVRTLPELEQAAHDGRLAKVPGFGEERVHSVRVSLAGILSSAAQRHAREVETGESAEDEPPVSLLLTIDEAYREKADAGELRKIAPKRFNPDNEAWLPIFEGDRQGWHYTALFSNTARAHDLDKTHDWVVIYYEREGKEEGQVTVVTETHGDLEGKRVVRGREAACRRFYERKE